MRLRSPYTLFKRQTSHGSIWHVSWYDGHGTRHTRALMVIDPNLKDRGRTLAARKALDIVRATLRKIPTLQEYAGDFYRWEISPWIRRQHAKGRGFNRQWAHSLQAMLENHMFPKWGRTTLDALNRVAIENWIGPAPICAICARVDWRKGGSVCVAFPRRSRRDSSTIAEPTPGTVGSASRSKRGGRRFSRAGRSLRIGEGKK